jgi:hypothetical protein
MIKGDFGGIIILEARMRGAFGEEGSSTSIERASFIEQYRQLLPRLYLPVSGFDDSILRPNRINFI